jgi:hypothetical protein
VKLLLDECVTRHLKPDLSGHEVHTVEDAGFKGLENGDLLKAEIGLCGLEVQSYSEQNCRDVSERRRNSKSSANASNCSLGNFSMTRNGGGFPGLAVDVKAILSSFAHELAALTFKMSN